jgi:GT2 family glycosyltransferase
MSTVAVVIPTCDRPELLARALTSVMRQKYPPLSIIVVDNGRQALSAAFKQRFPDASFMRMTPRCGVAVARNQGALAGDSDYIAFLDDDDYWPDEFLARMIESAERNGYALVASPIELDDGSVRRPVPVTCRGHVPAWRKTGHGGSNLLVHRTAFWQAGGFPTRLLTGEDRGLFIEAVLKGFNVGICDDTSCFMTAHAGDRLTDNNSLLRGKLDFLLAYGPRMTRRERREDQFAFLVYLSRAWGIPLWIPGCLVFPDVGFRRLRRKLKGRVE